MTNHGDDCYFFYYSTCAKGDSCPFRHCEAAMGSETVCNMWQEGRCFRTICKFRHMEITKNRKEIPCYWENQPAGCQKPHCAFLHEKARCIDGVFVPPDRCVSKNEEQPLEDPAPPLAAPLLTVAIPQLRGVIKSEAQEAVPSPTHPPVVINPADDDEDEDEEGEDNKIGPSPRKLPKSDDSLNFGVSTLEEIRLRKALKASMKKVGYPIQSTLANGEKENLQSFFRPDLYEAGDGPLVPLEETGRPRASVTARLGRKMPGTSLKVGEGFVLKRSLAERLGKFVEEDASQPPQKSLKSMKERLCLPAVPVAPTHPAETNTESNNAPEQFHIKTLEEIRQEKASKCQPQCQNDSPLLGGPESTKTPTPRASRGVKRVITVKDDSVGRVKTFSEVLHAKKKRLEEQNSRLKKPSLSLEKAESDTTEPVPETTNVGEVKVKTLEEIRREKAAMLQAQHAMEPENKRTSDNEENRVKKSHRLHINKLASLTGSITKEKSGDVAGKPLKTQTAASETSFATSNDVKVKTFEEIMREKRLRKQEMEEQDKVLSEEVHSQKQTVDGILKRQAPVNRHSSPSSTLTPHSTSSSEKLPARKPMPLKSSATSPLNSTTHLATTVAAVVAVTSVPVKQSSYPKGQESHLKCPQSSGALPETSKDTRNSTVLSTEKQSRAGRQVPTAEPPTTDKTLSSKQKKSPEHNRDTKVRPKLNVKPSVMKPAVQVKPDQKKGTERSAVAAVKPLKSSCRKNEEQRQETMHRGTQEFQSTAEAQLSSADPHSPGTLLNSDFSSTPLREELQSVPVFKQSQGQESIATATVATTKDTCAVPQSPVQKTPLQSKARSSVVSRTPSTSSATPSTSAVDDFEELMNEFTDDHLEEDMDPGIGEDDLLQELSEMIDS